MQATDLVTRRFVLWEIQQLLARKAWVVIDVETTSIPGQVIQWAVCAPDSTVLGSGLVRPTVPIKRDATKKHGLTTRMLKSMPTFDQVASLIYGLLENKVVVGYNVEFDLSALRTSCWAHLHDQPSNALRELLWNTRQACVMHWFAAIYGERKPWSEYYTWKTLETACGYFDIPLTQAHNAISDAQATVQLIQKMADLAGQELPPDFDFFAWEETVH